MIKKVPIQWFVEVHLCDNCYRKGKEFEMKSMGSYFSVREAKLHIQCAGCGFSDTVSADNFNTPQWERVPELCSSPFHIPYLDGGKGGGVTDEEWLKENPSGLGKDGKTFLPLEAAPHPKDFDSSEGYFRALAKWVSTPHRCSKCLSPLRLERETYADGRESWHNKVCPTCKPPENPPRMPQDRSEQEGLGGMVGEKQGFPEPTLEQREAYAHGYAKGFTMGFMAERSGGSEAGGKVGATGGLGGDKDTPNPDYFTPEDNTITGGGFMGRYEYVEIQKEGKPVRFWRESTGGIPPTQ